MLFSLQSPLESRLNVGDSEFRGADFESKSIGTAQGRTRDPSTVALRIKQAEVAGATKVLAVKPDHAKLVRTIGAKRRHALRGPHGKTRHNAVVAIALRKTRFEENGCPYLGKRINRNDNRCL